MNLFDSHCHLENGRFEADLPEVMARMKDAGVNRCILAGSDMETSEQIVALTKEHAHVYGVCGRWSVTAVRSGAGKSTVLN